MAGTRTAPTIDGLETYSLVTLSVIDASGDMFSQTFRYASTPTDLNIESLVASYQASTQASVYKVQITQTYEGQAEPANAETDQRNSVKQGVNMLFKDLSTGVTVTPRLVAPVTAIMDANLDIPNTGSTEFLNFRTAMLTLSPSLTYDSSQYTERRERSNNPRIRD